MNMSESSSTLNDNDQQQREERFRHVDLSHPLMQVLFTMQLDLQTGAIIAE